MLRNHKVSLSFVALYTAITLALMSPLAKTGIRNSTVWPEGDASLPIWTNGFVSHLSQWFHDGAPFYTDSIYHPHGLNLLANTTSFGLAVLLIPITWLVGPIGSFNVSMFISPILSATAMMWCLKRVVPSPSARGVAGLIWGFSPFAMEAFYWGWPNFLLLVAPPLVMWALIELLHRDISPRRLGLVVGVALAIQVTIGAEIAALCVVATAIAVVFFGLPYLAVRRRLPGQLDWIRLGRTSAWATLGFTPIGLPVALYATFGPAHLDTWVWDEVFMRTGTPWSPLVNDPIVSGSLGFRWDPVMPNHFFFGWPALITLALAAALLRHPLARVVSVLGLVGIWFMRGGDAFLHPLEIFWRLPVFRNIISGRYIVFTWFALAVLTAFAMSAGLKFLRARDVRPPVQAGVVAAMLFVVLYQPAHAVIFAGPWHTQSPRHDPALSLYGKNATSTKVVMAYPAWKSASSMIQQVTEPLHIKLIGGWGPQPGYSSRELSTATYLLRINAGLMPLPSHERLVELNAFVNSRKVDTILIPRHFSFSKERGYIEPYQAAALFTYMYGAPRELLGSWIWEKSDHAPHGSWQLDASMNPLTEKTWQRCAWGVGNVNPRGVPKCVVKASEAAAR